MVSVAATMTEKPGTPQMLYCETDVRAALLYHALRGVLRDEQLSVMLADITDGIDAVTIGDLILRAEENFRQNGNLRLTTEAFTLVRVSPWVPGPRRVAYALWLPEQR